MLYRGPILFGVEKTVEQIELLTGVVGSTAYGLAHAGSDLDRLGVFAYPSSELWKVGRVLPETFASHEPDVTRHELAKFVRLAMACNPTVSELLWLDSYDVETQWGTDLISIRDAFLSREKVRNAYLGYAEAQFKKLSARGDSFSSDTRARTSKHARHLFRLIEQGQALYTTGRLTVRVADREFYAAVSTWDIDTIAVEYAAREAAFPAAGAPSPLPEQPDLDAINEFLVAFRNAHLP
jgi:predicted nucleotidyltransferase